MASPLLPGELRAPRAPRFSPSPLLPGEPFSSPSPFARWQASKRFASLEELELLHPGTLETFALEEAPPLGVLLYEGDVWILVCERGPGPNAVDFETHIERETFCHEELEPLELRLYLWFRDEGCQL